MRWFACALVAALLAPAPGLAYETNGRHWDQMPIPYWVNPAGAPDFGDGRSPEQVVADAVASWASVGCASVSFEYMGTTDGGWAHDGKNTIYWVAEGWEWGNGAAGATLWKPFGPGEPMEVDLALNADQFRWVAGGGDALQSDVVDPQAVITHEIGHWLGLAHSPHQFATMYQALLPAGVQATLDGDDRAGVCSLYPSGEPDCLSDADCGEGHACREVAGAVVCDELHDPTGAHCDRRHLNCDGMCFISFYECSSICAFTAADYGDGYCAPLCGQFDYCPAGYDCVHLVQPEVAVCLLEEAPEGGADAAGPAPDGQAGDVAEVGPEPVAETLPEPAEAPDPSPEGTPEPAPEPAPDPGPEVQPGPARATGSGCGAGLGGGACPVTLLTLLAGWGARRASRGVRGAPSRNRRDARPGTRP